MLRPRERRGPQMPNQLPKMVEERIASFSIAHPASELKATGWKLERMLSDNGNESRATSRRPLTR
ncbi:MAG: hypothetical protein ACLPUT_01885 [Solirubrobacteraceae bacterium]